MGVGGLFLRERDLVRFEFFVEKLPEEYALLEGVPLLVVVWQ